MTKPTGFETEHIGERNNVLQSLQARSLNPFLPIGQFMAPKLIILIKCLIDILFFKVLF